MGKGFHLCGGVVLALLSNYKRNPDTHNNASGKRYTSYSEAELLLELAKIANPSFSTYLSVSDRRMVTFTSNYRLCKTNGNDMFTFHKEPTKKVFTQNIKENYNQLLESMTHFVDKYFDNSSNQDEYFVKAILEIIQKDNIEDDQSFYIIESGISVTKKELLTMKSFNLYSFILGIWYYAIVDVSDNRIGKDTMDEICPQDIRSKNSKRVYIANWGEKSSFDISVYYESTRNETCQDTINEIDIKESEEIDSIIPSIDNTNDEVSDSAIRNKSNSTIIESKETKTISFENTNLLNDNYRIISDFFSDLGEEIRYCIDTDFSFCCDKPYIIENMEEKCRCWNFKAHQLTDINLRKLFFNILANLISFKEFLSEEYTYKQIISEDDECDINKSITDIDGKIFLFPRKDIDLLDYTKKLKALRNELINNYKSLCHNE